MKELGRFFRSYCSDKHTAWTLRLDQINLWLNYALHSTAGYTSYELHFGKKPYDAICSKINFPPECSKPHEVITKIANPRTREAYERRVAKQKSYSKVSINIGDLVLLRVPHQYSALDRKISKFFHLYYGPYRIARAFNFNAFELVDMNDPSQIIEHYNRSDFRKYKSFSPEPLGSLESLAITIWSSNQESSVSVNDWVMS